jgi:hypothetical protein
MVVRRGYFVAQQDNTQVILRPTIDDETGRRDEAWFKREIAAATGLSILFSDNKGSTMRVA